MYFNPTIYHPFLAILLLSFVQNVAYAQFWELGISAGACSYIGDLNPKSVFANSSVEGAALLRFNWHPHFSTRFAFTYGRLQADDNKSPTPSIRERNLDFNSKLWEMG